MMLIKIKLMKMNKKKNSMYESHHITPKRVQFVFSIESNSRPIFLEEPLVVKAYQIASVSFQTVPTDPGAMLYIVSCSDLSDAFQLPTIVTQSFPMNSFERRHIIASIPQPLLYQNQIFEKIVFDDEKTLRQITLTVGNENGIYDSSKINSGSRFCIVIDFFIK